MPPKDPKFEALEAVYAALKPLNQQERQEIVASVFALLGGTLPQPQTALTPPVAPPGAMHTPSSASTPSRPKGLMELIQERHPGTNPQRIVVFAYWRERHEGFARFSREDFKTYFGKAHLPPPKNYDRDFNLAIQKGWIHEDGAESYITTKGIEVVEVGFEGERSYSPRTKGAAKIKASRRSAKRNAQSKTK